MVPVVRWKRLAGHLNEQMLRRGFESVEAESWEAAKTAEARPGAVAARHPATWLALGDGARQTRLSLDAQLPSASKKQRVGIMAKANAALTDLRTDLPLLGGPAAPPWIRLRRKTPGLEDAEPAS